MKAPNDPKQYPDSLTRPQIPHSARVPGQRSVPGPPGRLPRLPAGSTAQRLGGRRLGIRLPSRRHRQPVVGHDRREPRGVRHPRRAGQPGSRDHLPALHQRAARHQRGRRRRPARRCGRAGRLGRRTRPGARRPGRPRPRRLQQAGLQGQQRRPGRSGQVPHRVLRHRGRPVPAQRPAASGSTPASAAGAAAPAAGAEQRPPSAPGR